MSCYQHRNSHHKDKALWMDRIHWVDYHKRCPSNIEGSSLSPGSKTNLTRVAPQVHNGLIIIMEIIYLERWSLYWNRAINSHLYLPLMGCMQSYLCSSGVGVTKPIASNPLFSQVFIIIKSLVSYYRSSSYLTGISPAELWWQLLYRNAIQRI